LKPAGQTKYSLIWAATVVEKLMKCYPRATELLDIFYGMSIEKSIWLLANDQIRWNKYKTAVKILDRWDNQCVRCSGHRLDFTLQEQKVFDRLLKSDRLLKNT